MRLLIYILLSVIVIDATSAQDCLNPTKYREKMQAADSCIAVGNYSLAYDNYNAAAVYCKDSLGIINQAKDELFAKIDGQREEAEFQKENAEKKTRAIQNMALVSQLKSIDPTLALRVAEYNYKEHSEIPEITSDFYELLNNRSYFFYNYLYKIEDQRDFSPEKLYISPSGNYVLLTDRESAKLINKTGEEIFSLNLPNELGRIDEVTFSPDEDFIVLISDSFLKKKAISIYDKRGNKVDSFALPKCNFLSTSPDGKYFLTLQVEKSKEKEGRPFEPTNLITKLTLWNIKGEPLFSEYQTRPNSVLSGRILKFSPNGQNIIATTQKNKSIKIWDLTGQLIVEIGKFKDEINTVELSKEGKYIVITTFSGMIELFDLEKNQVVFLIENPKSVLYEGADAIFQRAAFSQGGNYISSTDRIDQSIKIYDFNGREIRTIFAHEYEGTLIFDPRFSSDDRYILFEIRHNTSRKRTIILDLHTNQEQELSSAESLRFNPNGKEIIGFNSNSSSKTVNIWYLNNDESSVFEYKHFKDQSIQHAQFSTTGDYIVLTGNSYQKKAAMTLKILKLGGDEVNTINIKNEFGKPVVSPKDEIFLIRNDEKSSIPIYNFDGKKIAQLIGHKKKINTVVFSPDGNYIVTGSDDGTAKLWNSQGHFLLDVLPKKDAISSVVFSPNGKNFMTITISGSLSIWDIHGALVTNLNGEEVSKAVFSQSGQHVFFLSKTGLGTINLESNISRYLRSGNECEGIELSSDGKYFLFDCYSALLILDSTGNRVSLLNDMPMPFSKYSFSPKGDLLAIAKYDGSLAIWSLLDQEPITLKRGKSSITSIGFTPDDNYMITGEELGGARMWLTPAALFNNRLASFDILDFKMNGVQIEMKTMK